MIYKFKNAFRGYLVAINDKSIFIIVFLAVISIIASFILNFTQFEIITVIMLSALIITLEMINSAIEMTCNLITNQQNEQIKKIKDLSAAAVLTACIFAFGIGIYFIIF